MTLRDLLANLGALPPEAMELDVHFANDWGEAERVNVVILYNYPAEPPYGHPAHRVVMLAGSEANL